MARKPRKPKELRTPVQILADRYIEEQNRRLGPIARTSGVDQQAERQFLAPDLSGFEDHYNLEMDRRVEAEMLEAGFMLP